MRIVFIIFIVFFSKVIGYADEPYKLTVINPKGIELKSKPNIYSKTLKHLNFGDIILSDFDHLSKYVISKYYVLDTIDNVIGYWLKAYHEKSKQSGFAFAPYLNSSTIVDSNITNISINLLQEGVVCGKLNYHPNLFWYGVYKVDSESCQSNYYIKQVEINLLNSKASNDSIFNSTYGLGEKFNKSIFDTQGQLVITTNQKQKSVYLFGLKEYIEEGKIEIAFINEHKSHRPNKNNGFIYPLETQVFPLDYGYREIQFIGSEEIKVDSINHTLKRKYKLFCKHRGILIDFSKLLGLREAAKNYSSWQTPQIDFMSDINRDGKLEIIFLTNNRSGGCGLQYTYWLFEEQIENDSLEFKLISDFTDCY